MSDSCTFLIVCGFFFLMLRRSPRSTRTHSFPTRRSSDLNLQYLEAQGDLTVCDDATQDIEGVVAIVAQVAAAGLLPDKAAIGLDPQGQSQQIGRAHV